MVNKRTRNEEIRRTISETSATLARRSERGVAQAKGVLGEVAQARAEARTSVFRRPIRRVARRVTAPSIRMGKEEPRTDPITGEIIETKRGKITEKEKIRRAAGRRISGLLSPKRMRKLPKIAKIRREQNVQEAMRKKYELYFRRRR